MLGPLNIKMTFESNCRLIGREIILKKKTRELWHRVVNPDHLKLTYIYLLKNSYC